MKGMAKKRIKNGWIIPLLVVLLSSHVAPSLSSLHPSPSTFHQTKYTLHQVNDSLYWLNNWRLPYPVYRFCTGDVNGDGQTDALVGVIKSTRYHPETAKRIFIFKMVDGKKVRPLWLGASLGATLVDFRFVDGRVRALVTDGDNHYAVAEYEWKDFGLIFLHFIVENTNKENAIRQF
jgi:hypothetical protein